MWYKQEVEKDQRPLKALGFFLRKRGLFILADF